MLLPPGAAEVRPPAAVATDCVGALGVFLAGPVLVFVPFLALLCYGDYRQNRNRTDHAPVSPLMDRPGVRRHVAEEHARRRRPREPGAPGGDG